MSAIAELAEDRVVEGVYAVARKQRLRTRAGAAYLALELVDPSGRIAARVWNDVELLDARFAEGDAVRVLGRVERFRCGQIILVNASAAGGSLQIDGGMTLLGTGYVGPFGNPGPLGYIYDPADITNAGHIVAALGGELILNGTNFTNTGSVSAPVGAMLNITPSGNFNNAGNIDFNGSTLTLGSATQHMDKLWNNQFELGHAELKRRFSPNRRWQPYITTAATGRFSILLAYWTTPGNILDIGSGGLFGTRRTEFF